MVLAAGATHVDLRTQRVPNSITLPLIVFGLVWPSIGASRVELATCLGTSLFVFIGAIAPFVAWRRGITGGGTVKLAIALSLLLPWEGALGLLVATIVWAILRSVRVRAAEAPTIDDTSFSFPLTPFFLAVTLLVVLMRFVRLG